MGYILNEDQKSLVAMAHDFCEKEIKPYAAQWDRDGTFPLETYKKAMEIGYHCLEIPEEYGGGGIDYVTVAAVMEEFAKYDLGFATTLMGTTLSLKPVLMHGTPEQKKMYADVIVGGGLGAFALTEAGAGSDAAACRTTAVREGDEYVINGTKCFITNSTYAEIFVVFASTNREAGVKGLSAFIVERNRPGFSVDKHEDKMGIRTSDTASLVFDNVRIPADHLLGKEGEGFKYAMQTLDLARPFVGASAVGLAQRAVDEAVKYAKERICFGKPSPSSRPSSSCWPTWRSAWRPPARWSSTLSSWPRPTSPIVRKLPWPSAMPETWPSRWPATRCRSWAAMATAGSTRWRSCCVTPRSSRSTRAPTRCSAWSSPASCCADEPGNGYPLPAPPPPAHAYGGWCEGAMGERLSCF